MHAQLLQSCLSLCDPMEPSRLLCPWNYPEKNTGVDCHFLLQGLFLTGIEQVTLTFPALAGEFFTISATWEAQ